MQTVLEQIVNGGTASSAAATLAALSTGGAAVATAVEAAQKLSLEHQTFSQSLRLMAESG